MTSRNPPSDDFQPGTSWEREMKSADRAVKMCFPELGEKRLGLSKISAPRLEGPPLKELDGKLNELMTKNGNALRMYERGDKIRKMKKRINPEQNQTEEMKAVFDHLRTPFPEKKKMIKFEIKKEVEEREIPPEEVTIKVEEGRTEVVEVRSVVKMEMNEEEWEVADKRMEVDEWSREVKKEKEEKETKKAVKEVKKEEKGVRTADGDVKLDKGYVRGDYPHHRHFLLSPTKKGAVTGPHPNELSVSGYYSRLYKVMYDGSYMTHLKTKDFVRRFNGKCGEKYKQFDYPHPPSDPRSRYRKVDQPKNMLVANLTVDDQYMGIPPKREVTISNLNDNVNAEFLKKMARNHKLEPQDVMVFHHPETRKHLGMALILFVKSKDARAFIDACDGSSVMGLAITCILDPFAAQLAAKYTEMVTLPLPPLSYLSGMSDHELSLRREKIYGAIVPPITEAEDAAPPALVVKEEQRERSLSPMDTSNSPMYEALPPPPINAPIPQHAHYDDAGTSTYKMEPPPPYSELPPSNHGVFEERRSESRRRTPEPEEKPRRDKRRRPSTSSSSSNSSAGEGEGSSSRHRSDGGVKKKREEYLKVKRYVSSERDSNGDKRILKEVKTVTYKRRTEQRTTIPDQKSASPDSFDEEMKRRERSMSKGKRSGGRDGMGWSSPSSDSDNGRGRGRKRTKEQGEDEKRPQPPADPAPSAPYTPSASTPSLSTCSTTPSTSSRRSGFQCAPIFDPTQPPPVIVPPVGLVLPSATSLPPPPPQHLPHPPPMMVLPPPPLPGGFIPPPEFFGIQSNAAMLSAASAVFAGLPPLPPGLPPPPPMMASMMGGMTPMMGGATPMTPMMPFGGATPLPSYASPAKTPKPQTPYKSTPLAEEPAASTSFSATVSSPSLTSSGGLARASSSSSLATMSGRTPLADKVMTTPTTPSDGGSTPLAASAASAAAAAEKKEKANLDDRLSQLFGLKKKKEEEAKEMKHAASAPSISTMAPVEQKPREDDDMDIDDDDDMDVASSSSEPAMEVTMERREEKREMGETNESEDERNRKEKEIKRKEYEADKLTKKTLEKLMNELQQQLTKDLMRKCEATAFIVLGEWERKQKNEGEEKKKQMIRDNLAAAAAREKESPKKDPMEEMLANKLMSPEGLHCGISKVFSSINIIKKKNLAADFSRDGTPMSRDSRAPSREKSRSSSRSTSSSSEDYRRRREESSQSAESSVDSDEDEEEVSRTKGVRRRPNMRNIESSQESSSDSSDSDSDSESDDRDKENEAAFPFADEDVDVMAMSEDEADQIKEELKGASSPEEAGPSTATGIAASAAVAEEEKVLKTEEEEAPPPPPLPLPRISAATAALLAAEVQAEQLRPQPSMKPDEGGYDPIRYDHPYVRQLGVPFVEYRKVPAAIRPPSLAAPSFRPPAAAVAPPIIFKPAKKKIEGEKVPHELLGLLPCPVPKERKEKKPRAIFKKRPPEEEIRIRDSFKAGMDREDEEYLQMALAEMQLNGTRPFGVQKEVEFESRLRAFTPAELLKPAKVGRVDLFFQDPELLGVVPHSTGCARAEGFYRLSMKQKIRIMRRPEAFQDRTEINERDEVVTRHQVQAQKEQRSMNRRLQTMVDSNPNSEFFKVNQLKYRKKMIKFARSRIHGWGLYALEPIAPDDMIVEYIGQKIRPIIADEREKQYERRGIGSSYLFRIDEDEVIDATRQGNFARFINHSCQPNCYAKVVTVDGDKRIVIYSKTLIQKGDEITYDYKFPLEEDKIECLCGAPSCRGTLN